MVIDWDGKFTLENNQMNQNLYIQVIIMMILILNLAMVLLFMADVVRLSWDSFGILVATIVPIFGR